MAGVLLAGSAVAGPSGVLPGNAIFSSYRTNALDVNNISMAVGGATSAIAGSPNAQEFTVAGTTSLFSLTVRLSDATAATDQGSILVYLVPNNPVPSLNLPDVTGLVLNNKTLLGTILDTSIGTTPSNVTIPISGLLSTGTYWLALVNGSDTANGGTNQFASNALWWRAGDLIGLDLGNDPGNTDAGLFNDHVAPNTTVLKSATNGAFEMQINTPEPASLALLGAGLLGLGFVRRRQTKKTAM
jgi:hypothetical protein